ncbi:MAG: hypothetical protein WAL67_04135 [Candidatus Cybelea sp.]
MDIFNGDYEWSSSRATQQRLGYRRELARPAIEDHAVATVGFPSKTRRCEALGDSCRQRLVQLAKDVNERAHRRRHMLEKLAAKDRRTVCFELLKHLK